MTVDQNEVILTLSSGDKIVFSNYTIQEMINEIEKEGSYIQEGILHMDTDVFEEFVIYKKHIVKIEKYNKPE
ncbi:hypothetical protein [Exiguobacterium artemiae]|uniref:hypothetical protein n=1 Tax=Exiguobacterium artemiae TaxID=340145 RepID=UPI003CFC7B12